MQKSREELQMPLKLYDMSLKKFFTCLFETKWLVYGVCVLSVCYMVVSVGHPCVGS